MLQGASMRFSNRGGLPAVLALAQLGLTFLGVGGCPALPDLGSAAPEGNGPAEKLLARQSDLVPDEVVPGDLNCDGTVDFGDINPFVLRLTGPAEYQSEYPDCPDANGDINADGGVDFGDINPFVVLVDGCSEGPFCISGHLCNYMNVPVAGLEVVFVGVGESTGMDFVAVSNDEGNYSQEVPGGWSGFVTSDANHGFEPPSISYEGVSGDCPQQNYEVFRSYYVDYATGSDSAPGTITAPFRTIGCGRGQARPGDTVYLRGGTYPVTADVEWKPGNRVNGTADHPITLKSYPGELAIIDGQGTTQRILRIRDGTEWWRFEDLEVRNGAINCIEVLSSAYIDLVGIVAHDVQSAIVIGASHDIIVDSCETYHFTSKGFHCRYSTVDTTFINCVAHDGIQGAEDGWEVNNSCARTTFLGCEAYNVADAGFDLASDTIIDGCIARDCPTGFKLWDSRKQNPDGQHLFVRSFVYNCSANGVMACVRASGSHGGGGGDNHVTILNSTFVDCKQHIWVGTSSDEGYSSTATIRNTNATHACNQGGGGTIRALYVETENDCRLLEETNNCWHRSDGTAVICYRNVDYTSTQINNGQWTAATGFGQDSFSADPQYVDLPNLNCYLLPGSPCIDAGVDVGFPYLGAAPDLGAFESQ